MFCSIKDGQIICFNLIFFLGKEVKGSLKKKHKQSEIYFMVDFSTDIWTLFDEEISKYLISKFNTIEKIERGTYELFSIKAGLWLPDAMAEVRRKLEEKQESIEYLYKEFLADYTLVFQINVKQFKEKHCLLEEDFINILNKMHIPVNIVLVK